ncbi:unnamed protein product [Hermetia illucens]|uniref:Uncharacterized protein n=1 Tax=Hermetia illucens TaxID=343691 RepID=A0A7R8UJ96_HERIL|nr:unnamed protein product [Hermetia illucens]
MAEWVKVKRQKRGAAPAPVPDEELSEASLDSAAEEEGAASEPRRITPAEKIAGLNKIIFQQNRTIAELRSQIAAGEQPSRSPSTVRRPSTSDAPYNHPRSVNRRKETSK